MNTLRFPDPSTTTRPDVPIADAFLVEGMESEVVDADFFLLPFASDVESDETVTPLRLLCSVDHGLRPADETSAIIGLNAAAEVFGTLVDFFGGNSRSLDWWGTMVDVLGVDGWTGGWLPDEHADVDVHGWSHEMESAAWSAGLIAETNGDSGMSWMYAPTCAPIAHPSADVRPVVPDALSYTPFAITDDGETLCTTCVEDTTNPVHVGDVEATDEVSCAHCNRVIVECQDDESDVAPVRWVHDPSRDGAGCTWCGAYAQVDADNLCRECFPD